MAVTVKLPTQLRGVAGGAAEAQSSRRDGRRGARGRSTPQHGELRERIAGEDGELRRFVNVYLKGEDIRFLDGLATPVADGDEVTILPAVAGRLAPRAARCGSVDAAQRAAAAAARSGDVRVSVVARPARRRDDRHLDAQRA